MKAILYIGLTTTIICGTAAAQEASADRTAPDAYAVANTTPPEADALSTKPEYVPMTFSERARKYIIGAFGPGAILRAVASGGVAQLNNTPKEWRQGSEAFGDRVGSSLAQNVIRQALEFGSSTALKQDNRYFRSNETGFGKRAKHAVTSVFLARSENGGAQFAYTRFGSVLGAAFISRIWEPRSEDKAGDAMVSFGLNMVADLGWNFFHEFSPRSLTRRIHMH